MPCVLSLLTVVACLKRGSTQRAASWALECALEWVDVVGGKGLYGAVLADALPLRVTDTCGAGFRL